MSDMLRGMYRDRLHMAYDSKWLAIWVRVHPSESGRKECSTVHVGYAEARQSTKSGIMGHDRSLVLPLIDKDLSSSIVRVELDCSVIYARHSASILLRDEVSRCYSRASSLLMRGVIVSHTVRQKMAEVLPLHGRLMGVRPFNYDCIRCVILYSPKLPSSVSARHPSYSYVMLLIRIDQHCSDLKLPRFDMVHQ